MDLGKLGSYYIVGSEDALQGNEIITRTYWRQPYSSTALLATFKKIFQLHPQLKSTWSNETLEWQPLEDSKFEILLEKEASKILKPISEEELLTQFEPSSSSLPFRIRVFKPDQQPDEVIFLINHAFANGLSSVHWISRWFEMYANYSGLSVGVSASAGREPHLGALSKRYQNPSGRYSTSRTLLKKLRGILWAVIYLIRFTIRVRKHPTTIDLSRGQIPKLEGKYATRSFLLDTDTTQRLIEFAKNSDQSLGELICIELIGALFQTQSNRDRICFSIPADLRNTLTQIPLDAPGNYTSSLIAQTFRTENTRLSVQQTFRWLRRNTPYGIVQIFSWLAANPQKLLEHFKQQTRKPLPQRAPFEDFTFALSNLGVIQDPVMEELLSRISMYTKTQTLFVGAFTFSGRLSIDICLSTDLFSEDECSLTLKRAIQALTSYKAPETSTAPKIIKPSAVTSSLPTTYLNPPSD